MSINRAKAADQPSQPFPRGPQGLAASRALAFGQPCRLLFGQRRRAPIEWGMGRGPAAARIGGTTGEGVAEHGGAHGPDHAKPRPAATKQR